MKSKRVIKSLIVAVSGLLGAGLIYADDFSDPQAVGTTIMGWVDVLKTVGIAIVGLMGIAVIALSGWNISRNLAGHQTKFGVIASVLLIAVGGIFIYLSVGGIVAMFGGK